MAPIILRFRSKDGLYRQQCDPTQSLGSVIDELLITKIPRVSPTSVHLTISGNNVALNDVREKTLQELGLKHGDMITLEYEKQVANVATSVKGASITTTTANTTATVAINTALEKQDKLDDELDADPGLIPRVQGPLCRHSAKGMCEYCAPLPPWDKEYQADHNIKHISFHAHLTELKSGTAKHMDQGSSYIAPLTPSDFAINKKCTGGHEPWPRGICSKCQPSAITLQRQNFRMVDHVEFADSGMVNDFIDAWRQTGVQRCGLLLGTYERYDKIPLGVKARVTAIYELPQSDRDDGIILEDWVGSGEEDMVMETCRRLNLVPVGVVFTDLSDAGRGDGSVICKRHVKSFFMSSLEIVFASKWQLKYAHKCKWSETGSFSSRFVTCIISGNPSGEIDISAYQTSEAAEALVRANIICAATHPNQMMLRETNDERYVPDVFFQRVNEYGLVERTSAAPAFPVEYLLVSLTHGFPEQEEDTTTSQLPEAIRRFPIENRGYMGQHASAEDVASGVLALGAEKVVKGAKIANVAVHVTLAAVRAAHDRGVAVSAMQGKSTQQLVFP